MVVASGPNRRVGGILIGWTRTTTTLRTLEDAWLEFESNPASWFAQLGRLSIMTQMPLHSQTESDATTQRWGWCNATLCNAMLCNAVMRCDAMHHNAGVNVIWWTDWSRARKASSLARKQWSFCQKRKGFISAFLLHVPSLRTTTATSCGKK